MMTKNNITSLDECLMGRSSIGIAGHVHPDGDCIGSTLAIYNYIRKYYPEIPVHLYLEPIPNIFKFLQNADKIENTCGEDLCFDLFIASDCSDTGRLGQAAAYFERAQHTLCIDHHATNSGSFAEFNYIFPEASSASELVFELAGCEKITREIAECLYTGIIHDTGVFQYSCTSKKTMAIGGMLMEMGIDYPKIVDETFYTKTFCQNKILGQALLNSCLYLDGKVIVSVITREEMARYEVLPKHLDGIVNQLRVTKDVSVALFLYENEDGTFKGSLRVNGPVNVAEVAAAFGGGGHVKAAGFTIEGPADTAVDRVLEVIRKQL